ncbi:MAG: hypothetical protein ACLFSZ_05400 [Puniceicoccaceae bacterium]
MIFSPGRFIRDAVWLAAFALLAAGCVSSSRNEPEAGPEVGPVAAVLDGDEDADPLAAEIDLSNEAAEDAGYDPD